MKEGSIVGSGKNMLSGQFAEMSDIPSQSGYKHFVLFCDNNSSNSSSEFELTVEDDDIPALVLMFSSYTISQAHLKLVNNTSKTIKTKAIEYKSNAGELLENEIESGNEHTFYLSTTAFQGIGTNRGLIVVSPMIITFAS